MTLFDPDAPPAGGPGVGTGTASLSAMSLVARAAAPVRVRMTVAYDGTGFHGFAAQPGQRTVAGELGRAIEALAGHPVDITCAGRTDAGVHAAGQVVHVDLEPARVRPALLVGAPVGGGVDPGVLARGCNRMLAPAIVVVSAGVAPPGFDARRSAVWRHYRYLVLNRPTADPFLAATSWHVAEPLDLRAMQLACDAVHGEHDFSSFCRRPSAPEATLVRRVLSASWSPADVAPARSRVATEEASDLLRFDIRAGAFCHQMVRSLVGTMVDMGRGRKRAGDMAWILRCRDRSQAASPAPPQGLCLMEVGYPPDGDLATLAAAGPPGPVAGSEGSGAAPPNA